MHSVIEAKSMKFFPKRDSIGHALSFEKKNVYHDIYDLYCCKFVNLINLLQNGMVSMAVWLKEEPWDMAGSAVLPRGLKEIFQ